VDADISTALGGAAIGAASAIGSKPQSIDAPIKRPKIFFGAMCNPPHFKCCLRPELNLDGVLCAVSTLLMT
jgi:hypothetical protein